MNFSTVLKLKTHFLQWELNLTFFGPNLTKNNLRTQNTYKLKYMYFSF